ncbi:hypothetical protein [Planotetraspora kaengkrachanensis]|uniref:Uncharacterized protein n=1 Tax=Planotetraspora kaengkrachanensis TaxID=575193 RepID=A0A8J3M729_9ACTN|nr:hypothetical protein [Planotetraspora kaengkrachanensis]GIG80601.1 hypothetical protein Pka01_37280 [Planotetraspora kaengkrachanensis]
MTESGENPPQNPVPDGPAAKDATPEKEPAPDGPAPHDDTGDTTPKDEPAPDGPAPLDDAKNAAAKDEPAPDDAGPGDEPPRAPRAQAPPPYQPPPYVPPRQPPPPFAGTAPAGRPRQGGIKKSSVIKLGMIGGLSTLVVGFCVAQNRSDEVNADCVDTSSRQADGSYAVVGDDYCDDTRYHGPHGAYAWYYGGARVAGRVLNGTTIKPSGSQISTRSGRVIQRGGFGFHSGGGG